MGRNMLGVFLGWAGRRPLSVQPLGLSDERLKLLPERIRLGKCPSTESTPSWWAPNLPQVGGHQDVESEHFLLEHLQALLGPRNS